VTIYFLQRHRNSIQDANDEEMRDKAREVFEAVVAAITT
jgi:hypothetical protein